MTTGTEIFAALSKLAKQEGWPSMLTERFEDLPGKEMPFTHDQIDAWKLKYLQQDGILQCHLKENGSYTYIPTRLMYSLMTMQKPWWQRLKIWLRQLI